MKHQHQISHDLILKSETDLNNAERQREMQRGTRTQIEAEADRERQSTTQRETHRETESDRGEGTHCSAVGTFLLYWFCRLRWQTRS